MKRRARRKARETRGNVPPHALARLGLRCGRLASENCLDQREILAADRGQTHRPSPPGSSEIRLRGDRRRPSTKASSRCGGVRALGAVPSVALAFCKTTFQDSTWFSVRSLPSGIPARSRNTARSARLISSASVSNPTGPGLGSGSRSFVGMYLYRAQTSMGWSIVESAGEAGNLHSVPLRRYTFRSSGCGSRLSEPVPIITRGLPGVSSRCFAPSSLGIRYRRPSSLTRASSEMHSNRPFSLLYTRAAAKLFPPSVAKLRASAFRCSPVLSTGSSLGFPYFFTWSCVHFTSIIGISKGAARAAGPSGCRSLSRTSTWHLRSVQHALVACQLGISHGPAR